MALPALYLVQPLRLPAWGVAALASGLGGTFWLCACTFTARRTRSWVPWLGDLLVFLFALALYLSTLAPSVLPGDSGEFQLVAPTLGIPHPTGYPLYLLLGKLISWLPVGSVAYRLNLLSALAAAGAVWAVYRAGRALGLRQAAALVGAGLLAVSSTLWSQATIAEKYTLNAFFVGATLWLGLRWRRAHLAGGDRRSRRWLYAWAACYGLSLAHHRTMLLLGPAYALLFWFTDRRLVPERRSIARLLLLGLAPLALYLLLPLFSSLNPPYAYQRVDSVSAFLDLVLARDYQGSLFRGGWGGLWPRLAEAGRLLARQFGWPGLIAGVLGWGMALRRSWRLAVTLLLGMAAQFVFAANYYVPNTFVYYLPVYVWLAVCAAAGVDAALRTAQTVPLKRWANHGRIVGVHLALVCVLLAAGWVVHLGAARWAGMDRGRAYGQQAFDAQYGRMAARSVDAGALIVSDWMPATVLWYTQYVEGLMPGAQVTVADPLEGLWQGPVERGLAEGRPVYLARPVLAAGDRYALSSAGPLVQVLDAPRVPESPPDVDYRVEGHSGPAEIALLGANLVAFAPGPESAAVPLRPQAHAQVWGGGTLHVTLIWRASRPPEGDYGVRVRWIDAFGRTWVEQQNRHPVAGSYPTSRWTSGKVVSDAYALALPPYLAAGDYRLQAAMGPPGGEPSWITVASLQLSPVEGVRLPTGTQVRKPFAGGWVLVGYQAPQAWAPGETATVAVEWLACAAGGSAQAEGERPRLWLISREGVARRVEALPGESLLGESQPADRRRVEWFRFAVDGKLDHVEMRGPSRWGPRETRFWLPVPVSEAPPGTNFDNKLRLRSAAYGAESYRPGETVQLTLEWEAMRAMDEAYKVFVHVLGANGLPVAQQDNEPLNGTYPTTRWQPGERVSDRYAIDLPADLPPGEYAVEVGLYRISDLTRLPVRDAEQNVVDDKLYLEPLVVR
jgi:hypothetical protein